jgi:acetyl esterase/lipase
MRSPIGYSMKVCTRFLVLAMILVTAKTAVAAEPATPDDGDKPSRRVKLVEEPVRSEERLYRKAPEGELYLHFFFPPDWKADDARPAIVLFFGGSWKVGSYQQMVPQAEYFASRGLVAAAADYRIQSKHHTTPDKSVEDAKSAMRWVRTHARELGIDPDKIIAGGGSAGGHLAAATALVDGFNAAEDDTSVSCRPCALVLFNPVLNLTHLPDKRMAAGTSDATKKQLSPTFYLQKSTPPAVLFYGTADDKYRPQGEEYVAKAKELGLRADLHFAPEMSHGFFNHSPWTEVTAQKADEFLTSLGYLKGPPTIKLPKDAPRLKKQ